MKFETLNDVEAYVREHLKDWTIKRGKDTIIPDVAPDKDYEVIQLFRPGRPKRPYAEFWKGYYNFNPEGHTGFFGPSMWGGFSCQGNLQYAMEDGVLMEAKRL